MVQPLSARLIPAEFLTANYYILGQLKVLQSGLMGMMSDPHSSYMEISEASISHVYKPDKVINYAPVLFVVKAQVVAVCLNKREYVGMHGVSRGGYMRLIPYPVQITTPTYEIHGTLEWAGRFEFSALMSEGTNAFFMLYDAVVKAPLFPALHIESPAVLMNRTFLDTMVVLKKPVKE
ncbi:MAG: hypothetical protein JW726_08405 [Anaerolineales bacterium]|nr:hypothetical protein [Anaerolineales bacterium]